MREMAPSLRSLLSGPEVYNHIMLRGRVRKDTFRCKEKKKKKSLSSNKLVFGSVGGTWLGIRAMQRLVCSVNKFSSLVGRWVGVFIKWEKKVDIRSPDTPPLSALDCLFRADFSCKHGGWRASSSPAKLSSQMGCWPFPPLVFLVFFFFFPSKSPSCLFLLFPVLIYNLPETVDSHSLTAKRIRRGKNQGAATHKENSQGGAACTNPIDVTYRLG